MWAGGGRNLNGELLLLAAGTDPVTLFLGDGLDGPVVGIAGFGIWNGDGCELVDPDAAAGATPPIGGEGRGGGTILGEEDETGGHTGRGDAPPAAGATGLGIANPAGCVGRTTGFGATGAAAGGADITTLFGEAS